MHARDHSPFGQACGWVEGAGREARVGAEAEIGPRRVWAWWAVKKHPRLMRRRIRATAAAQVCGGSLVSLRSCAITRTEHGVNSSNNSDTCTRPHTHTHAHKRMHQLRWCARRHRASISAASDEMLQNCALHLERVRMRARKCERVLACTFRISGRCSRSSRSICSDGTARLPSGGSSSDT